MSGCNSGESARKGVPVVRTPMLVPAPFCSVPYQFSGKLGAIWSGDTVELLESSGIHCVRLIGVDCPQSPQPKFEESRRLVWQFAQGKTLSVHVIRRDEAGVEFGRIIVSDQDLGLELVRAGLAWFDESEFEGGEGYSRAQAEAREKKLAIWSEQSPVAPWDFYEQQVAKIRENAMAAGDAVPHQNPEQ